MNDAKPGRAQHPSLPGESSMLAKYQKLVSPRAMLLITAMRPRLLNTADPDATAAMRSDDADDAAQGHVQPGILEVTLVDATISGI